MVSRLDRPNPPCVKKERNFKEVLIHNHSQQIFSADFFSRSSQQIFSADFLQQIFSADLLSRSSQQIFSADLLSRFFSRSSQQIFSADFLQQIFSADLLSRSSQQIFSADLLSRSSQQIFSLSYQQIFSADLLSRFSSADLLSRSSQQIFSADFLSRSSQQIFSADLLIVLSFAVVRGWWSAIVLSFLSFAVVRGWWSAIVLSFAVVRGWWSAIVLSCWWSILHEFFRRTLSRSFREKWKTRVLSITKKKYTTTTSNIKETSPNLASEHQQLGIFPKKKQLLSDQKNPKTKKNILPTSNFTSFCSMGKLYLWGLQPCFISLCYRSLG